ncbi:carbohydrate ABC transporter permease [Leifsonia poae]|uniref:carbohydrate ABC transporter permease n=1 Tax=Leifsonia poae TaxID=110933 RepID=UPI001CBAD5C7|nr:carbohydrate ABC transporter permease [Leifsonia poae]
MTTIKTRPDIRFAPPTAHPSERRRVRPGRIVSATLLLLVTVVILLPVILLLVNSVRTDGDVAAHPIGFPSPFAWGNYAFVFDQMNYLRSIGNTLLIAASSVVLIIITASAAAWAIARHVRRWTRAMYQLFIAGLTIPVFVITTPLYILMQQLGLLDTYIAPILIYTAFNLPFALFFYVSFLRSIPEELEDAAAIDGCGPFRTFWHVIFPLLRPATATVIIFVILNIWNDVTIPLLFLTSDDLKTVTLSVYSFVGTNGTVQASQLFPAVVLATAPLVAVFLFLQRHIVAGITAGVGK